MKKPALIIATISLFVSLLSPISVSAAAACNPTSTTSTINGAQYVYLAFKATGLCSWTAPQGVTQVDVLLVAGGGGGAGGSSGAGGGGGAGGFIEQSDQSLPAGGVVDITVGTGGNAGGTTGTNGGDSIATLSSTLTAKGGGGGGGGYSSTATAGLQGGSGGGGGGVGGAFAAGGAALSALQGNSGGSGSGNYSGGGGGGAGGIGGNGAATNGGTSGAGGLGKTVTWIDKTIAVSLGVGDTSSTSAVFASGGGGSGYGVSSYAAVKTLGGGGEGGTSSNGQTGTAGLSNTGGGGGGGFNTSGSRGGSGVVVLRYADLVTPTVTLTAPTSSNSYIGESTSVTATSNSTGTLSISTSNTNICTVTGTTSGTSSVTATLNFIASGSCVVTASAAADTTYAAGSATKTITIHPAATITITAPTSLDGYIGETTTVTTTANSSGTLTLSTSDSNICTLTGTTSGTSPVSATITFIAGATSSTSGSCVLTASVSAAGSFSAGSVTKTITVYPRSTITFTTPLTTAVIGQETTFATMTTPSTGITVVYSSTTTDVCSLVGAVVTYLAVGECIIKANAAKTATYSAALEVTTTVTVSEFGVATKLGIVQSAGGALANTLLAPQPIINLLDAFNNIVKVHDAVSVNVSTGGSNLVGTADVAFVNGVAEFTNLQVSAAGTYTLTFSSSGLTSATQNLVISSSFPACTPTKTFVNTNSEAVLTFKNTSLCDWTVPAGVSSVDVLVVGGGGGYGSGGGGSGGFNEKTSVPVTPGQGVTVVAGKGGAQSCQTCYTSRGADGASSVFGSLEAGGGGGGGRGTSSPTFNGGDAKASPTYSTIPANFARGNGGGGGSSSGSLRTGGIGTFNGGGSPSSSGIGGGGGGAGGEGAEGIPGLGKTSSITGSSVLYARGGIGAGTSTANQYSSVTNSGNGNEDGVVIVRYVMPASKLAIEAATGTKLAGVTFSPRIQLQNEASLLRTSDSATVTVTVTGAGTTFAAGTTSVSTVSGVAEFAGLSLTKVGTYTLTYTPTGLSSVTAAITETVTITAAEASAIEIVSGNQQSAVVSTAVATAPKVKVVDQYGNAVAGASVTFTVTTGALSNSTPVTTAADGTATTPTWTLGETKGTQTLTASVSGLTSALITATATGVSQTITFNSLTNKTIGDADFTVTATTTATGLTVAFDSTTKSICTIAGATITLLTAGQCSITATQAGDSTFAAASPVTRSFTVASAPAPTPVMCDANIHNGITVTASHGKTFYVDLKITPKTDASYIGYIIKNTTNATMKDLWVNLKDFTGGALSLAHPKDAYQQIESIPAGGTVTVYFLLQATVESTTAQQHTVVVTQGHPDSNGVSTYYSCFYSFNQVLGTIKAAANKVTSVSYSTLSPVIGGTMTITIKGEPGVIGAGASPDGSIIWLTPTAYSTWPTRSLRLEQVRLDIGVVPGATGCSTTYTDQLLVGQAEGCHKQMPYTATFTFRVIAAAAGPVVVAPVAQIASGTQIKHTDVGASASATLSIVPQQTVTVDKKAVTGAKRITIGGAVYAEVPYELTGTSLSNIESQLDQIVDTPPAGALFVTDSGKITYGCMATPITGVNPTTKSTDAGKWFFIGPFPVTYNCPIKIEYKAYLPLTAGTSTYSNVALADTGEQPVGDTPNTQPESQVVLPPDPGPAPNPGDEVNLNPTINNDVVVVLELSATTDPATDVTNATASTATATLNGRIYNSGSATISFEYRVKTAGNDGAFTPVTSPTTVAGNPLYASKSITGLSMETTYEYRIKAEVGAVTTLGQLVEFRTPNNRSLLITTETVLNGQVDVAYGVVDLAADVIGMTGEVWSITNGVLPIGLVIDPATGAISGTPTVAGTYTFSVMVAEPKPDGAAADWEPLVYSIKTYTIIIGKVLPTASITTNDATLVSKNSAQLNGTVDYVASGNAITFEYWENATPGTKTTVTVALSSGSAEQIYLWTLNGLKPSTQYSYYIKSATDPLTGTTKTFTTLGEPAAPPVQSVQTKAASGVAQNAAVINGSQSNVKPGDNLIFRYSKTADLSGAQIIDAGKSNGASAQDFAVSLDALTAGTTYYYQIVTGDLAGQILSFRTSTPPAPPSAGNPEPVVPPVVRPTPPAPVTPPTPPTPVTPPTPPAPVTPPTPQPILVQPPKPAAPAALQPPARPVTPPAAPTAPIYAAAPAVERNAPTVTTAPSEVIEIRQVTVQTTPASYGVQISGQDWSIAITSTKQLQQGSAAENTGKIQIEAGNTVTTFGTGFKPNSQVDVYVYSTPIWLGSVITDAQGNYVVTLPMPKSLPIGDHVFQAQGKTFDDVDRTANVPITLVPAALPSKASLSFEVFYALDSIALNSKAVAVITKAYKSVKARLTAKSVVTVAITGWVQPTNKSPRISYLSNGRATSVQNYLKRLGLKAKFVIKAPGHDKLNVAKSRRATAVISWTNPKS